MRLEQRPELIRHKLIDGSYMGVVASAEPKLQLSTVIERPSMATCSWGRAGSGAASTADPVDRAVSELLVERAARFALSPAPARGGGLGRAAALAAGRPAGDRALSRGKRALARHRTRGSGRGARADHGSAGGAGDLRRGAQGLELAPFDPDRFSSG